MENETLQLILKELQTLNENFSEFKVYITDRNNAIDEKQAEEGEVQQNTAETGLYQEQLAGIQSTLSSFEETASAYMADNAVVPEHLENIEFSASYTTSLLVVIIAVVSVLCGFKLGGVFFRKL